jgi:hypothetical protein
MDHMSSNTYLVMCDGVPNVKKNELKAWVEKVLNVCFFFFQYFKNNICKTLTTKKIQSCFITIRHCKKRREKREEKYK